MAMTQSDGLTMTIHEVAKALGTSWGLAYDLAKRDELPVKVIRLGNKRMVVSRKSLEILLSGETGEKMDQEETE